MARRTSVAVGVISSANALITAEAIALYFAARSISLRLFNT
jgi:hypothetical protein